MKRSKWILAALTLMLSCSSQRHTQKASIHDQELQRSAEQIELLTQRESLLQGLVITFDSVALAISPITHHPSPITVACGDSVPPHVVNLIARKASIEKSDIRTVTYEGLNAQRDTVATSKQKVEIVKSKKRRNQAASRRIGR